MKAVRMTRVVEKMDTEMISKVFYGNQFPVTMPAEEQYDLIENFVNDENMVTKIETGVYQVGFNKKQLNFLKYLMKSFDMTDADKMRPYRIFIQKTGICKADNTTYNHVTVPGNCVRIAMNYRKRDTKGRVAFSISLGTDTEKLSVPGTLFASRSFATVLQRNYSTLSISSGKALMGTRAESAQSYFVIADFYAPAKLIMEIVNNTAGANPIQFEKFLNNPSNKGMIDKVANTVTGGNLNMSEATQLLSKVLDTNKQAEKQKKAQDEEVVHCIKVDDI